MFNRILSSFLLVRDPQYNASWQILLSADPESLSSLSSFSSTCVRVSRLSYITTLSYMPGFPHWRFFCYHPPPSSSLGWLVLLSISRLFLVGPLLLRVVVVDVVVYLFAFSWTRHTINTTPLRPRPSAMRRTGILGTTSDESPHLRLKPLQLLNLSQRHSLLPGGGPSGSTDLLPTWTPAIRTCSVHGSNNPEKSSRRQRQRVQDDPHA